MDPFVAQIMLCGFNFAPRGWATCDGQLLPISQNTALFSLLGTFYGGNGTSVFALPNLQGQAAVNQGQGNGLSDYFLGQQTGSQTYTLQTSEIPTHTHSFSVYSGPVTAGDIKNTASGNSLSRGLSTGSGPHAVTTKLYATDIASNSVALQTELAAAGGNLPYKIMQPYLVLTHIIAMQGVFPSRT
ncbi:phage tail protein [Mucilaginibacter sp.]|uniref:phage tail protein n=1 Tax=Mucilaginibacter sp. TaxID=1882438 RepID=UPI0026087971|nr:tail fiber protein [Mucilaginibacter sp.]MDB4922801.1 Tail Collar domain protein [Mucilaginibacter sp.]